MGFNTTVLILNDALSWIKEDPDFTDRLCDAILQVGLGGKTSIDVPARSMGGGVHCNAATVIESHHADVKTVISVGGNCAVVLGSVMGPRNDGLPESQLAILKDLLEQRGYYIAKIPKPTRPNPCDCGHAFRTHKMLRHPNDEPVEPGFGACAAKGCECWHFDDERK